MSLYMELDKLYSFHCLCLTYWSH